MDRWQTKTLGEVLLRTETANPALSPDDEFDYIDVSSVSNETYAIEVTQRLKGRDAPSRARRLVRAGDVLLATIRPTLRRIAVVPVELDSQVCSTGYFVLRPCSEIDHRFLFYSLFTEQFMGAMESLQKGASYPAVTDAEVRAQPLSFPATLEQRRIVAILDEAFEGIAAAKANAEKNLRNARELFEWHHQAAFTRARETSADQRLGDIASFRNGINYTKQSKGRLLRIIGVRNFQDHFWAPTDDLDSVTLDGALGALDAVEEGDILSVRSNGNPELIGRCMLVGKFTGQVTHSGFTIRIRLQSRDSLPQYVCQFLKSREVRRKLVEGGTGLNIKSLNQGMLSNLVIPVPSVETQRLVVDEIEAMTEATAELADIATRKLEALDELRMSLLRRAFIGALTTEFSGMHIEAVE